MSPSSSGHDQPASPGEYIPEVDMANQGSETHSHSAAGASSDDVLERALERHMAEQRGLQATLAELRDLVRWAASRGGSTADSDVSLRSVSEDVGATRSGVVAVSSDIEGLALALMELSSGLRDWAERIEATMADLRDGVAGVGEATAEALEEASRGPSAEELESRLAGIEKGLGETTEVFTYFSDQVEDLDTVMSRVSELPTSLEGVVSQAMRRVMAARAKLDTEAEEALSETLADLSGSVSDLEGVADRLRENEESISEVSERQAELGSQMESLQAELLDRIEAFEERQAERDDALVSVIESLPLGDAQGAAKAVKPRVSKKAGKGATAPKASKQSKPAKRKASPRGSSKSARSKKS